MLHIAVIGAGVIGLSSAINVQKTFPNAKVTIIADKFFSETTSFGAGGLFRPNLDHLVRGDNSAELMRQCVRDSWKHYSGLAMSDKAKESGQMLASGISAHSVPLDKAYEALKGCAFDFHRVPVSELKRRGIPFEYGYSMISVISQPDIYLDWLMKQFKSNGGEVQKRRVNKIEELYGDYQLVVNCCGLEALTFLGDKECLPIRGQLVAVKAPWVRQFYYSEVDIYIIPHVDKIIIGGIRIEGDSNSAVDLAVSESILKKAQGVFPELKCAEVISSWAGLRPGRSQIRLEIEMVDVGNNRKLPVVHNYGHGGHGITMAWGTSVHAAKLAKKALSSVPKASL